MVRNEVIIEIKKKWPEIMPTIADTIIKENEIEYICPICKKDHIKNEGNRLYCNSCGFNGSIIDLHEKTTGATWEQSTEFLANQLNIYIDGQPQKTQLEAPTSDFISNNDKLTEEDIKTPKNAYFDPSIGYGKYYYKCLEFAKAQKIINADFISPLISLKTIENYYIGFDYCADPSNAPGITTEEENGHQAARVIIPLTPNSYYTISQDINTPAKYKNLWPKGSPAEIFNREILKYSGNNTILVFDNPIESLIAISAGFMSISYNGRPDLIKNYIETEYIKAPLLIVYKNLDGQQTAEEIKKIAILKGIKAGTWRSGNDHKKLIENLPAAIRALNNDYITKFWEKINTEAYKPNATGIDFFDDLLNGGIMNQSLLVLLAAPGIGKTTLAQQIGEAMAANKRPVLYLNYEMSNEQMIAKEISRELFSLFINGYKDGVKLTMTQILQAYKLNKIDRDKVKKALDNYKENNFKWIKYRPDGATNEINELREYLNTMGEAARQNGKEAPAIIVDYLHLLTSNDKKMDAAAIIKEAVKMLKDYAIEYNTIVIAISAINRDSSINGKVNIDSGRDTSGIEYTADYVLSMNYKELENGNISPKSDPEEYERIKQDPDAFITLKLRKSRFSAKEAGTDIYIKGAYNSITTIKNGIPPLPPGYKEKENETFFNNIDTF